MLLFCEHVFMLGGGSSVGGECYLRYLLFGMIPLDYDVQSDTVPEAHIALIEYSITRIRYL